MGVLSAVEHIFNETAMHAKAQASNRMEKANRASHGPRVRAKERVKRTREKSKGKSKGTKSANQGAKGLHKGKHRKLVSQVLKTRNQRQIQKLMKLRSLNFMTVGVMMSGMMTGVVLDGTKVGNIRQTIPQAHFHVEVWMSVPPEVRSGLNG